jgi:hypothetical protein
MQLHFVAIQAFRQDALEGFEIAILVEHGGACIAAIQGVVKAASLIGTFRSGHSRILSNSPLLINES